MTASLPGVAFVLFRSPASGRCLWLHRQDGTYGLPGGHIEPGEAPIQAAIRECIEEVGHAPQSGLTLALQEGRVWVYTCEDPEFALALSDEHDGAIWATPEEMPEPLAKFLAPGTMDERVVDANGWVLLRRQRITKAGVFPYYGREIGAPEPDKIYGVLRPPEELARPEFLASLVGNPVVNEHPPNFLGNSDFRLSTDDYPPSGSIVSAGEVDGEYVVADCKLLSAAMLEDIESGKREMSAGILCSFAQESGVHEGKPYQYKMRGLTGNHLALVQNGRCGPDVGVMDQQLEGVPMADQPQSPGSGEEKPAATIADVLTAIKDLTAMLGGMVPAQKPAGTEDVTPPASAATATPGAGTETPTEERKEAANGVMDAKAIAGAIRAEEAAKAKLYALASPVLGTFDHAAMSLGEMGAQVCKDLGLTAPAGQELLVATTHLTAVANFANSHAARQPGGTLDSSTGGGDLISQMKGGKS